MNTIISGPVQISVERDLNIHGGGACASDVPDDCVLPRGSGSWSIPLKVGGALVALVIGTATVLHAAELAAQAGAWCFSVVAALAASMVAWITSTVALIVSMSTVVCVWTVRIVLGGWMVGRAAELYLLIERALGGGPWRLIIVSKLFGQRRVEVEVELCPQPELPQRASSMPRLAAGKSRGLAAINTREAFTSKRQEPTSPTI